MGKFKDLCIERFSIENTENISLMDIVGNLGMLHQMIILYIRNEWGFDYNFSKDEIDNIIMTFFNNNQYINFFKQYFNENEINLLKEDILEDLINHNIIKLKENENEAI